MTRPPRNHRITIIYQILHLCTVELTWTCTMQSEAYFHVTNHTNTNFHSTTMASSVLRSAGIGNSNTGATFLFHETGNQLRVYFGIFSDSCLGNMPPINFRVELKACFCRKKLLTSSIRHNRNNFHLTWESTFPTSAWASDGVDSFLTAGGCDDSGESDWPTATTRSKQFR